MNNKDLKNIQQIKQCIESIQIYISQNNIKTYEDFENNAMLVEACIFNLSQIGEMVNKIPNELQQQYPNIPGIEINGMRNKIVHDYFGINTVIVGNTINKDLDNLYTSLTSIEILIKEELGINSKNKEQNPSVDLGHGRERVETKRPEGVDDEKMSSLDKNKDINKGKC